MSAKIKVRKTNFHHKLSNQRLLQILKNVTENLNNIVKKLNKNLTAEGFKLLN